MNDMPQTALAVIPASQLPTILAADTDDILGKLAAEINGFHGDVTTEKGRKEIASKAYKVATAKQDLIRLAGTLKEGAQKTIKSVNAEVAVVEERMNALRDQVRAPLDAFQEREKSRIAEHKAAIAEIVGWSAIDPAWTAAQIGERIAELSAHPHREREWQEFREKAQEAARASFNALKVAQMEAAEREKAEAEAARVAAEEAEAKRLADEQAQREREERIAAEAARRAKEEAERIAAEQAAEAERHVQAERDAAASREQEQRNARVRAEQERAEAQERARQVEAQREVERVERHRSAIRTIEAQAEFTGNPKAADIQARIDGLTQPFRWDFQEFADEAERSRASVLARLTTMHGAAKQREDEAAEAERVAREAAQKRREEQAVEAERARLKAQEAAEAAETQRRAANVAHRRKVNREALTAIMIAMSDEHSGTPEEAEKIATAIVVAIAKGAVTHITISY